MKMSDIIKLNDKTSGSEKKKFPYAMPQVPRKEDRPKAEAYDGLQVKKVEEPQAVVRDEKKDMEGLYQRHINEMRSIFDRAKLDFTIAPAKNSIQEITREMVDKLLLSDVDIIKFFMKSNKEDYIYSHSVNVAFLSVMLGVWLNYNKFDLNQLATAALLHDIGMAKVLKYALMPRRLRFLERREVARHPDYSKDFISQMPDMDSRVIEAAHNHHRRLGTSSKIIDEHSQIIGIVDTFEAMTHPRSYKRVLEPHSAIRKVIEDLKDMFDSHIIKALVDNIGVYPVGTWVRLDTEEIGLVIDVNSGFPLSPKVNILFNEKAEKLQEPRTVDLSKQKNIHIKNPLEEEVRLKIKEILSR
ncbi:MAG: HD domain-containing protein [Candidatus Omnitrophica bacterium]|nr:HD domain-containing protein [Candidatus Omnitrophota bacterium]